MGIYYTTEIAYGLSISYDDMNRIYKDVDWDVDNICDLMGIDTTLVEVTSMGEHMNVPDLVFYAVGTYANYNIEDFGQVISINKFDIERKINCMAELFRICLILGLDSSDIGWKLGLSVG